MHSTLLKLLWCAAILSAVTVRAAETSGVTARFDNADILKVLEGMCANSGVSLVTTEGVGGKVTAQFRGTPWEEAMASILRPKGLWYVREGNVVTILPLAAAKERWEAEQNADSIAPLVTEVVRLKYVDAIAVSEAVKSCLSKRGSVQVFRKTEQGRWKTGIESTETRLRKKSDREEKSMVLVINDTTQAVREVLAVIRSLDVMPKMIRVDVYMLEIAVNDEIKLGIKWQPSAKLTGSKAPTTFPLAQNTPSGSMSVLHAPASTDFPSGQGAFPYAAASSWVFGSVDFTRFQAELEAQEVDKHVNVLSCPSVLVTDNNEATILVGERYPIIRSTTTDQGTTTETFDHYEPVGIQLLVVPEVLDNGMISMAIHPAVTEIGQSVQGATNLSLNRITAREADTQIVLKDGQTAVIGGLIRDRVSPTVTKVPFLGDIPILKYIFRHTDKVTEKVDLLIFVTPRVVENAEAEKEQKQQLDTLLKEAQGHAGKAP